MPSCRKIRRMHIDWPAGMLDTGKIYQKSFNVSSCGPCSFVRTWRSCKTSSTLLAQLCVSASPTFSKRSACSYGVHNLQVHFECCMRSFVSAESLGFYIRWHKCTPCYAGGVPGSEQGVASEHGDTPQDFWSEAVWGWPQGA